MTYTDSIATALVLLLALSGLMYCRYNTSTQRWYRSLSLKTHQAAHDSIFKDINGFVLSKEARKHNEAIEYTYGEIEFLHIVALLSLTQPGPHTVFYDLGSGTGKAVLAAAMVFQTQKNTGIELFSPLYQAALTAQEQLQNLPDYHERAKTIQFINNNFLHTDFRDATLIFINATTFFGDLWDGLNQQLATVKHNTIVITTSRKLSPTFFTITRKTSIQMSWGVVNAYIHTRNRYKTN